MPKLRCNITGHQYYITDQNLQKKATDSEKTIPEFLEIYICKKAEMLLRKGYSIDNIRDLLECEDELPAISEEVEAAIRDEYNKSSVRRVLANYESVSSLATNESDPEVASYIAMLKSEKK